MSAPDEPDLDDPGGADLSGVGWLDGWSALSPAERYADLIVALTPPAPPTRARRPSPASRLRVIKAAEKAGLPVKAATIDGVALEFGQPAAASAPAPEATDNPWDAAVYNATH